VRSSAGITGAVLLHILLTLSLPACSGAEEGNSGAGQTFFAGQTDEDGQVILKIAGQDVPLKFVDETLGCPVSGLSVGVAQDANVPGLGVMLIVDPFEDYPLQMALLYEEPAAASDSPGELLVQGGSSGDANNIPNAILAGTIRLTRQSVGLIKALTLQLHLSEAAQAGFTKLDSSLRLMYMIGNLAKWMDKCGVPLGKYVGMVGTTEILTKEEAANQLFASWGNAQSIIGLFFFGSLRTGAFSPPAVVPPALGSAFTLAAGVMINSSSAVLDFDTIVSCDDKVVVTSLGTARFYACYKPPKVVDPWPAKPNLCITVKDAKGVFAPGYGLELMNARNPGTSYLGVLDDQGRACIRVQPGDYKVRVFWPDSSLAATLDISVVAEETSLNITLPERVAANLFLKEIYTGGGIADLQMTTDPGSKDSGYGCLYTYTVSGLAVRLTMYQSQQEGPWMVVLGTLTGTSEKRYVPRKEDPDYGPDWEEPLAPFTCTGVGGLPGMPIDIALAPRGKVSDVLPGLPVNVVPDESGGVRARFTEVRAVENGEKMIGTLILESFPFENVRRENVTLSRQCRRFVDANELIQVTSQFVGIIP
jgi:hypothetical protein